MKKIIVILITFILIGITGFALAGDVTESGINNSVGGADEWNVGTQADPLAIQGTLTAVDDVDWYKLTITGTDPGIFNVSLKTPSDTGAMDYEVQVYQANDDTASKTFMYVADSGQNDEDNSNVTAWAAGPGYYYMRVQTVGGSSNSAKPYYLNTSFVPVPTMVVEDEILDKANDNEETSTADIMNVTGAGALKELEFFGTVRSATDQDWYEINLTGSSAGMLNITFETFFNDESGNHASHYLDLTFFGPLPSGTNDEDQIISGTDSGTAGAQLLTASMVAPGKYYLRIYDVAATSSSPYEPYRVYINFTPVKEVDASVQLESELIDLDDKNDLNLTASDIALSDVGSGVFNGTMWGTLLSESDVDWFNFTIPGSNWGNLEVTFDSPQWDYGGVYPTYTYVVYRTDNLTKEYLNASNQGNQAEYIDTLRGVRAASYQIKVTWADAGYTVCRSEPYRIHLSYEEDMTLPIEKEHLDDTFNGNASVAETITMTPPGGGVPYHEGWIYGTLTNETDEDFYTFEFDDAYVGDFRIYVFTPNHVINMQNMYLFYGPDSETNLAANAVQNGVTAEQEVSPTIPGGIPGKYLIHVYGDGVYDASHMYYIRIEFEPKDTATYAVAGTISGKVYNNITSEALDNITVEIKGMNTLSQWERWGAYVSGEDGSYTTSGMPKQDLLVEVNQNGFAPYSKQVTMEASTDLTHDIRIDPTYGSISGTAYWGSSANNNRRLPGVTVKVLGTSLETITDSQGNFEFLSVPTGAWTIEFTHPNYQTYQTFTTVYESQNSLVYGTLAQIFGDLRVIVLDKNGNNVTDASVTLFTVSSGTTYISYDLEKGYYHRESIQIGIYELHVTHASTAPINQSVTLLANQLVEVNLTLVNMSFIVNVIDAGTRMVLTSSNVKVTLYSLTKENATIEQEVGLQPYYVTAASWDSYNNHWKFTGVSPGEYLLNVTDKSWSFDYPSMEGRYLHYEERVLVETKDVVVNVSMVKPGVIIELVDKDTGASITGASVTLKSDTETYTDTLYDSYSTGFYSKQKQFKISGTYTLKITHNSYPELVKQITITDPVTNLVIELEQGKMFIKLEPGLKLYGYEVNEFEVEVLENGTLTPLEGVKIYESYFNNYYTTSSSGKATLTIEPDTPAIPSVILTCTLKGYREVTITIEISYGEAPTTGSIRGTIKESYYGKSGITVELWEGEMIGKKGDMDESTMTLLETKVTDSLGDYRFTNLSFKSYSISISKGQDYRVQPSWTNSQESDYYVVAVSSSSRLNTQDIYIQSNNKPAIMPRVESDFQTEDPYGKKIYDNYELTNDGHVFRVYVKDQDNDPPEYVKLHIAKKTFDMKEMKTTEAYKDEYGTQPPMQNGRYYEVTLDDSDIDSGTYNYSFSVKDPWASTATFFDADEEVKVRSLKDIVLQSNAVILGIMGVICAITLILFIIVRIKNRHSSYETSNKDLSVSGLGYYMESIDVPEESRSELDSPRREFIEGKIKAKELIAKLK